MLELMLVVCSNLGGSFDGETPAEWATVYQVVQQSRALTDNAWMEYYKTGRPPAGIGGGKSNRIQFAPNWVTPTMQWAVPNIMLKGAPQGPPLPFPDFGPYPPVPNQNP